MRAFLTSLRDGIDTRRVESEVLDPAVLSLATLPESAEQTDGRVRVEELIAGIKRDARFHDFRPLVVLTGRDLARVGCASLFGYADRNSQIAIVSTFRLQHPDPETMRVRLENLIRHEIGHLQGWRHCKEPGCLMCPAQTPEELDDRANHPCLRCSRRAARTSVWLRRASAALFLVLAFAGLNLSAYLLKPSPKAPFALTEAPPPADEAAGLLLFNGMRLNHSNSLIDPADAPEALNRLYRMIDPPPLHVMQRGDHEAAVVYENSELLRIRHDQPVAEATRLAEQLNDLLVAKGSRNSLCAECHLDRKPEVLEAANGRKWNIGPY